MTPAFMVAFLWLVFGGTHIGLAAVRGRIVARVGEVAFVAIFYVVAALSFAALVTYYAGHRYDGAPGLALGGMAVVRWLLMGIVMLAIALMTVALIDYPRLPSALFNDRIRIVRGIERITRHPFFSGTALLGAAHVLLATHLTGVVFFTGLMLLSVVGAAHQDRKLIARHGRPYADYCTATSTIPFLALLDGRQRLPWRELPLRGFALGAVLALALRYHHDSLFADRGMWIVAAVVGGGAVAGISAWRRSRRAGVRDLDSAARHLHA